MTAYVFCATCGKAGRFAGIAPHYDGPCPLLVAEHEKRMELLDAQIEREKMWAVQRPVTRA